MVSIDVKITGKSQTKFGADTKTGLGTVALVLSDEPTARLQECFRILIPNWFQTAFLTQGSHPTLQITCRPGQVAEACDIARQALDTARTQVALLEQSEQAHQGDEQHRADDIDEQMRKELLGVNIP